MLKKTSRALQSDVLSDGAISKKFGISTSRPITFGSVTLRQKRLLDAFRQALAGQKVRPLVTDSGKRLNITVSVEQNGSAVVTLNKTKYVFTHAGLMSPDAKARSGYLEQFLRERTLAKVYTDELRAKVAREALSNDDFLEIIETLLTSPEQFVQAVNAKVRAKNLTNTDLLPDDPRYWDNLIAPLKDSKTLEEFIDQECAAQRDDLIQQDAERAFLVSALSFCAPRLVPLEKFRVLDAETVLKMLAPAPVLGDHFAVVGAFEVCADWLVRDSRFEALGAKLLDHLLKDMEELKRRCAFYAAIYALTVARLAQHEVLHCKPPFWRRVTAAAHTSLVVRACGPENAEETYSWALGHSGKSFVYSVLLEGNEEPRWKPDWLTPKHFVADAFGRIDSAVKKIPESQRPTAWLDYISKGREWIAAQNAELLCMFPAIGESARREQPTHEQTGGYQPFLQELYDKPSFDSFIRCTPAFYTVGVTKRRSLQVTKS